MRHIVQHAPLDGLAVFMNHYSFAYVNVLNVLNVLSVLARAISIGCYRLRT
jgi:hypothetical protein